MELTTSTARRIRDRVPSTNSFSSDLADTQSVQEDNERLRLQVADLQLLVAKLQQQQSGGTPSKPSVSLRQVARARGIRRAQAKRTRSGDDNHETDEELSEHDIECHQSAAGLHHRKRPIHQAEIEALLEGDVSFATSSDEWDEEDVSFCDSVRDRAGWLVGLLCLQSMSSFIISRNEKLLQDHLVIVQFLTMLVGAGGNAGNQASVRGIRGLATGAVRDDNLNDFLWNEFRMGLTLSAILGVAGFARAAVFLVPAAETIAITTSLCAIVMISILLGAVLPLLMRRVNIDPAHSSTTIQVLMDILGVTITVRTCPLRLSALAWPYPQISHLPQTSVVLSSIHIFMNGSSTTQTTRCANSSITKHRKLL